MLQKIFVGWMLCLLCLTGGMVLADPPSQMFRIEGPGGSSWWFPDDERSRITASAEVVTPHLEWGKPWKGGPLRVLAIAHKVSGRWPIELSQRFDFRVTTIYTHTAEKLGDSRSERINQRPADVEARLLQAMNQPVHVIINDIPLATLGSRVEQRLTQLLEQGVGYVGPTKGLEIGGRTRDKQAERDMIRAAVPVAGLKAVSPAFGSVNSEEMLSLWDANNVGRMADLSGFVSETNPPNGILETAPDPGRLQYLWLVDLPWEAWCSLTGRAALWAAQRLPAATTLDVAWPDQPIRWADMPYRLSLAGIGGETVLVRVWDADGRLQYQGDDLTIPRLPAGRHFVGLQRSSQQGRSDWAFGSIEVISSQRIASVTINDPYRSLDDKVVAAITLEGDLERGSTLQLEVLDSYDRCIFVRETPAQKQVQFDGDLHESLHMYNYVNVKLFDKARNLVDEARHAFYIRQPSPPGDDLTTFVYEAGGRYPSWRIAMKRLTEMGMTAGLGGANLALVNVHPVDWNFTLGARVDDQGRVTPNIASSEYIQRIQTQMREDTKKLAPFSPAFYYLGDDVRYLKYGEDGGWSPEMRASLAKWAEQDYGNLEELNRAWETGYDRWEQIEPIKVSEALGAVRDTERPRYGPLCHWVDHQLHTEHRFARFHRLLGEAINEVDADTPSNIGCALAGWAEPATAFDWWKLSEGKQLGFQYPNPWAHEIYRSALAPGALHGIWYGGYGVYNYPPFYLDQDSLPWWSVFHGINVHGLYYGNIARPNDKLNVLLGPDLSYLEGMAKIAAHHKELKSGIAKLLFNADRVNDGVAMVYSPASLNVSAVFDQGLPKAPGWDGQGTGSDLMIYMQSWEGFMYLLRDLGLSFDVVPSSQLRDGQFLQGGFRVLVLPLNLRITEAEANTIRQFVSGGGLLIADAFPGLFNERCRADHLGVLADVLGVEFAGEIPGAKVQREAATSNGGVELARVVVDGGMTLAGAQANGETEGGTPILIAHEYGQGHAILLNVLARDYQIWRTAGTEMPFREAVGQLLADAGIDPYPFIKCMVSTGAASQHPIQVTGVYRYELDGANYVGLLRDHKLRPDEPTYMADLRAKPVTIKFDHQAHVYDIRRAMYRGHTDAIDDMVYPARAELYALLPYEVRDMTVQTEWAEGAIMVNAQIVPGDATTPLVTHVLHLEVTDPKGRLRGELTRNLIAESGRCSERLFVGYNAELAGWRITVRDVASGMVRKVSARPGPG